VNTLFYMALPADLTVLPFDRHKYRHIARPI